MIILTIAIPTYNRNHILSKNISFITPQLNDKSLLLIVDNSSPVPIQETISELPMNTRIVRNTSNLGGNGNILRCIELCESEWIWILGDDDKAEPGAIDQILNDINTNADCIYFNYSLRGTIESRSEGYVIGMTSLLQAVKNFGDILFISRGVFKVSSLRKFLDYGYHYAYSCAPHVAMLAMALQEGGKSFICNFPLISWERPEIENRGSLVPIALGLPTLLELPMSNKSKKLLAKKLSSFPDVTAVVHRLLLSTLYGNLPRFEARRIFWNILIRIPFYWSIRHRIFGCLLYLSLFFPKPFFHMIVKPLYFLKTGQKTGPHKLGVSNL